MVIEERLNFLAAHLRTGLLRRLLHHITDVLMHPLGQFDAVVALQYVRNTPLTRLAIDAHDRFIIAPQIGWIDRQIGHFPMSQTLVMVELQGLADRILVTAGKSGID